MAPQPPTSVSSLLSGSPPSAAALHNLTHCTFPLKWQEPLDPCHRASFGLTPNCSYLTEALWSSSWQAPKSTANNYYSVYSIYIYHAYTQKNSLPWALSKSHRQWPGSWVGFISMIPVPTAPSTLMILLFEGTSQLPLRISIVLF